MIEVHEILSLTAAAKRLGVDRATVRDLVKILGLEPRRMGKCQAKGLTAAEVEAIRRRLWGRSRRTPA